MTSFLCSGFSDKDKISIYKLCKLFMDDWDIILFFSLSFFTIFFLINFLT